MRSFIIVDANEGSNGFQVLAATTKNSEIHDGVYTPGGDPFTAIQCKNRDLNMVGGYNTPGAGSNRIDFKDDFIPVGSIVTDPVTGLKVTPNLDYLIHYCHSKSFSLTETNIPTYDGSGVYLGTTDKSITIPGDIVLADQDMDFTNEVAATKSIVVSGGEGADSFEVISGTLPDSITLNPITGELVYDGTDDVTAGEAVTFKVTDSGGYDSGIVTIYITVLVALADQANVFTDGSADTYQTVVTEGRGDQVFEITAGTLPSVVTFDTATGIFTYDGSAGAVAEVAITVAVTDNTGTVSGDVTISVA